MKKQNILEDGMQKLYFLIFGGFIKGVRTKVKGIPSHIIISTYVNPILVLVNINTFMFSFQYSKCLPHVIRNFKKCIYTYIQDRYTSVLDYHKSFCNNIDVVEKIVGIFLIYRLVVALSLSRHTTLIAMTDATQEDVNEIQAVSRESSLEFSFLLVAENLKMLKTWRTRKLRGNTSTPK